jgi:hypothetical protein
MRNANTEDLFVVCALVFSRSCEFDRLAILDCGILKVEAALRANPKSYGAWYHRKWLLNQKLTPVDSKREFGLLDKLLKVDARNFHGWNYRR